MSKTILITGATDGIGLETAKKLAADGHRLVLHGRNPDKLSSSQQAIGGDTTTLTADLSQLSQVRKFSEEAREQLGQLDVLINNAGVYKMPNPITKDGLDARFVVNTIAPYVLTRALLPALGRDGRVVNVSSAAQAPVDVAALNGERPLGDMDAYAQSKLAIVIWTQALATAHPNGPMFVAVNPGSLLASKMVREGFGVAGSDLSIGANILSDAALSDRFRGKSGNYFDNDSGAFAPPHHAAGNFAHNAAVMAALDTLADSI